MDASSWFENLPVIGSLPAEQLIPYNYLVFGLSRYDDGHTRP